MIKTEKQKENEKQRRARNAAAPQEKHGANCCWIGEAITVLYQKNIYSN